MMGRIHFFLLLIPLLWTACGVGKVQSSARPVEHQLWDSLVRTHVSEAGWVDYPGFREDSVRLNSYLELLSRNHPNDKYWTEEERLAYWINAYNAFTVKLIVDHYPVESIKDIKNGIPFVNTVWDIKFITIEGKEYDLNNIEHGIIRPRFDEPRIHFAVNCASVSCPVLRNEAYTAKRLDAQLADALRDFLADDLRNEVSPDHLRLSKLFSWYRGDFTKDRKLIEFLDQYAPVEIQPDATIEFLEYNWQLNEIANRPE